MKKPSDIVNRDREWEKLVQLWNEPRSQLIFMYGRRRVGKSWLLHRFAQAVDGIYYQATRGTQDEQLRRMTRVVGRYFDDAALKAGAALPDWESLFAYIGGKAADKPLLLVIDEFPYLAEESPSLTSVIQAQWDSHWKESSNIKLLLCGSHITLMKQLEERDQPLHGRRTAKIAVSPFIYNDLATLLPDYDRRTILFAYGIFGGLAGHLDRLDPDLDLSQNVARLILDPSSRLYDEATHVLDTFGKEADVHYSVLFAIADGARTWGRITNRVARSTGALWPVIEWLQEMELIEREVPITKEQPHKSKVSLYRITDPYLMFWYRFIQPIYSSGFIAMADPQALWRSRIEPRLDDYMGQIFEDICRDFTANFFPMPFEPHRLGRWWTRNSDEEVDIVVRGLNDELLVGECKWGGVTGRDLTTLKRRARLIATELGDVSTIYYALFSGSNQCDQSVQEARDNGDVFYFGPEDLFVP